MAKSKHVEYHMKEVPPLNIASPIRIEVTKHAHSEDIRGEPPPSEAAQSTYYVYGSMEEGLLCTCPSSHYHAQDGQCKHITDMVEPWLDMRAESFEQRNWYWSSINEKFIEYQPSKSKGEDNDHH